MNIKSAPLLKLRQSATAHNGACLTEGSQDTLVSYATFRCSKGHVWRALISKILAGGWCPKCAKKTITLTITDMQEIAQKRGGKCLSKKYINSEIKLEWRCERGHHWWTSPHNVRKGSWCPKCKHENQKNTLADVQALAAKRGGVCLSKRYINNATPLRWRCKEGHVWKAQSANLTMGQWCPTCARDRRRLSLYDLQAEARRRGGSCLSQSYRTNRQRLLWECRKGHRWQAAVNNVRNNKAWCPYCANNRPLTLQKIKQVAKERGGQCLSKSYKNNSMKLSWRCAAGHDWQATAREILNKKRWCQICRKNPRI